MEENIRLPPVRFQIMARDINHCKPMQKGVLTTDILNKNGILEVNKVIIIIIIIIVVVVVVVAAAAWI